MLAVPVHPIESIPVTVYVVVTVGVAVGLAQLLQLRLPEGNHEYVLPPEALSFILEPSQTLSLAGVAVTFGGVGSIRVVMVLYLHPAPSVTIRVYVPATRPVSFWFVSPLLHE